MEQSAAELAVAFLTLTSLEIVLGIDNIVFIAILAGKLPENQRDKARRTGIIAAMLSRIALLFSIVWVMKLTKPLFKLAGHDFTGKSLILLFGGLFLIYKATKEMYHKVEAHEDHAKATAAKVTFGAVIAQILLVDIVFSLDSVITAVGMTSSIAVMIAAVLVSVGVMLAFSGMIVRFVENHPSIKILALSFLLMIGVLLTAEGFGQHLNKGYVYFAMAFALTIDLLQMRLEKNALRRKAALEAGTT